MASTEMILNPDRLDKQCRPDQTIPKSQYFYGIFLCFRESDIAVNGQSFTIKKEMIKVKKYQKTVHGKLWAVKQEDIW